MKSSDDPKVIAVRQAAVAQQAVRRHDPGQTRSKAELQDRARVAAKRAKKMGAYVNPAKLREAVETSVVDTYLTFADAILEGSKGLKRSQRVVAGVRKTPTTDDNLESRNTKMIRALDRVTQAKNRGNKRFAKGMKKAMGDGGQD